MAAALIVVGLWSLRRETPPSSPSALSSIPAASVENRPPVSVGAEPSTPPAPVQETESRKVQPVKTETIKKEAAEQRPVKKEVMPKQTEVAAVERKADVFPPIETAAVPPAVEPPPPSAEQIEREKILSLLKRHEQAFESKDAKAYLADLARSGSEQRKEIEKAFEQYARIHVAFEIQKLELASDHATLEMIQTTRLAFKSPKPDQETRARVLWKLTKMEDRWKIQDTQIIEKIQ